MIRRLTLAGFRRGSVFTLYRGARESFFQAVSGSLSAISFKFGMALKPK